MFRKKLLLKTKFTLKLAIFVYFQVKRDSPYTCPKTFIISASYRYIINLQNPCVEVTISTLVYRNSDFYAA